MPYIHKFESFKKYRNEEPVNEELLGALFNWVKGYFQKAKKAINATKGGKEVQAIYDKYLELINKELAKKANIELHLKGEQEMIKQANQPKQQQVKTAESLLIKEEAEEDAAPVLSDEDKEDENNQKLDAATLKSKIGIVTKVLDAMKKNARTEMEKVITKYGGAEKNPDLKVIIDNKIKEFDLALLNAEMEYLEKAGDKTAVQTIKQKRDALQKNIEQEFSKIGTDAARAIKVGDVELKLGKKYRYKTDQGLKTIVIKDKSDEEGKVKASFVYGDSKDEIQNFTVDNIDVNFTPVKDKKYGYYSQNNNGVIDVTVISDPDEKGMVQVKTGKADFKVEIGSLLDKEEGDEEQK